MVSPLYWHHVVSARQKALKAYYEYVQEHWDAFGFETFEDVKNTFHEMKITACGMSADNDGKPRIAFAVFGMFPDEIDVPITDKVKQLKGWKNFLAAVRRNLHGQQKIKVEMIGPKKEFPECQEESCMHKRECANHKTAGDFRSEGGMTPHLSFVDGEWFCEKEDTEFQEGAMLLREGKLIAGVLKNQ